MWERPLLQLCCLGYKSHELHACRSWSALLGPAEHLDLLGSRAHLQYRSNCVDFRECLVIIGIGHHRNHTVMDATRTIDESARVPTSLCSVGVNTSAHSGRGGRGSVAGRLRRYSTVGVVCPQLPAGRRRRHVSDACDGCDRLCQ